ncbi:hypothetical protein BDW74DRAFT_183293 [Aspergillus multicolor]|uniref:uncharacterized protein n=1 Tax=Aspergillus multicolor TaxID=41759 RepID=UPI003CCE4B88
MDAIPVIQAAAAEAAAVARKRVTVPEFTQDDIGQYPAQLVGYRGYTAFKASCAAHSHYRRFDRLNAYVTQMLQQEASDAEAELEELELQARKAPFKNSFHNGTFSSASYQTRREIPTRRKRSYKVTMTYIEKEDLISTFPRETSTVHEFLLDSRWLVLPFWRKKETLPYYNGQDGVPLTSSWLDWYAKQLPIIVGMVLRIAPIWVLAYFDEILTKLTVVSIFIIAFSILLTAANIDSIKAIQLFGAIGA